MHVYSFPKHVDRRPRHKLNMHSNIGTLNESALHKSLKELYAEDGDEIECPVGDYIVDIKKTNRIVEIQTSNLHHVIPKLYNLLREHVLHLVYPIAARTTISKTQENGSVQQRKSPKKKTIFDIFAAFVSGPEIILHPNFSLEVPLIHEEQIRVYDGNRGWRKRHWITVDRRLIEPLDTHLFNDPHDLWLLFEKRVPVTFTTKQVSERVCITRRLAQQAVYCLRRCDVINAVGKERNEIIYALKKTN